MLSVTTKRGIRRGVVSSRHSSVAAVCSPAWQGLPRVTRLWGQIPGGLIQTVPDDYSLPWTDGLRPHHFSHLPPSCKRSKLRPKSSMGQIQGSGRGFSPWRSPGSPGCREPIPVFIRGSPSIPGSASVPQTYPETKHNKAPIAPTFRPQGALPAAPTGHPLNDKLTRASPPGPHAGAPSSSSPSYTCSSDTVLAFPFTLSGPSQPTVAPIAIPESC